MSDYKFIKFSPTEKSISDFINLFKDVFNETLSKDFVLKKYNNEIACNSWFAYTQDMQPVGFYGLFLAKFKFKDQVITGGQAGDVMTHPSQRGKGLFKKLATHVHNQSKADGIDFIFGFPNPIAYPVWKKLDWQFKENIKIYQLWVFTFPLSVIVSKIPGIKSLYQSYSNRVLAKYKTELAKFENSVISKNTGGSLRDSSYITYKNTDITQFISLKQFQAWVKLAKSLWVGDIVSSSQQPDLQAIKKLKKLAFWLGIPRIDFQISPNTPWDQLLSTKYSSKEGPPIGYLPLNTDVDLQHIKYTFCDFDTF